MTSLKYIFSLLIIFSFFTNINTYHITEIHLLISAKLNGTSPAIQLANLQQNQAYVYFLFDFSYHNTHVKKSKNVAYFKISTTLDLPTGEKSAKDSIAYRLSHKGWNQIKNNKIANNIMYKKAEIISKEEKNGVYNYYFKIEKKDDKKITLVIRVPTQKKREGFLNIYNILELPKK